MPPSKEVHKKIALALLLDKDIQKFAKLLCEYYYSNEIVFTSESAFENNLSDILKETGLNFSVKNQFRTGKGICDIFIENGNKREVFS